MAKETVRFLISLTELNLQVFSDHLLSGVVYNFGHMSCMLCD